jgi:surfactin synthase thioesterase subunit
LDSSPSSYGTGSWFVPQSSPSDSTACVYALPQAGGGCASFADLAQRLGPAHTVYALNLPGRQARFLEPPRVDLDGLLDDLTQDLADRPPGVLFGYCSGALLAFLLARRLRASKYPSPTGLIVASFPGPDHARPPRTLHLADHKTFWQQITSFGGIPGIVQDQPEFMELFETALRADYALLADYEYVEEPPLDLPIWVVRGDSDPDLTAPDLDRWRRHTTQAFTLTSVSGSHWLLDDAPTAVAQTIRLATGT